MPKHIRPPTEIAPLTNRLKNAILLAQAAATVPVHITLQRGLNISITADIDQTILLKIGRFKSEPSLLEWSTILKYWPWHINNAPQKEKDGDWNYFSAIIDKQKQINLL